jgi:hypothetical protein
MWSISAGSLRRLSRVRARMYREGARDKPKPLARACGPRRLPYSGSDGEMLRKGFSTVAWPRGCGNCSCLRPADMPAWTRAGTPLLRITLPDTRAASNSIGDEGWPFSGICSLPTVRATDGLCDHWLDWKRHAATAPLSQPRHPSREAPMARKRFHDGHQIAMWVHLQPRG